MSAENDCIRPKLYPLFFEEVGTTWNLELSRSFLWRFSASSNGFFRRMRTFAYFCGLPLRLTSDTKRRRKRPFLRRCRSCLIFWSYSYVWPCCPFSWTHLLTMWRCLAMNRILSITNNVRTRWNVTYRRRKYCKRITLYHISEIKIVRKFGSPSDAVSSYAPPCPCFQPCWPLLVSVRDGWRSVITTTIISCNFYSRREFY